MAPMWMTGVMLSVFARGFVVQESRAQIGIETCDELISSIGNRSASFKLLSDL